MFIILDQKRWYFGTEKCWRNSLISNFLLKNKRQDLTTFIRNHHLPSFLSFFLTFYLSLYLSIYLSWLEQIRYWKDSKTDNKIEIVQLFYWFIIKLIKNLSIYLSSSCFYSFLGSLSLFLHNSFNPHSSTSESD